MPFQLPPKPPKEDFPKLPPVPPYRLPWRCATHKPTWCLPPNRNYALPGPCPVEPPPSDCCLPGAVALTWSVGWRLGCQYVDPNSGDTIYCGGIVTPSGPLGGTVYLAKLTCGEPGLAQYGATLGVGFSYEEWNRVNDCTFGDTTTWQGVLAATVRLCAGDLGANDVQATIRAIIWDIDLNDPPPPADFCELWDFGYGFASDSALSGATHTKPYCAEGDHYASGISDMTQDMAGCFGMYRFSGTVTWVYP